MKNKKRILGVAIFILLISIVFIAGYSFARYYKSINGGNVHASIARWSFGSKNMSTTINLSDEKIAPGTSGEFEIEVDASGSEVAVDYEIKVENENNIPRNMKFYATTKDEKGGSSRTEAKNSFTQLATESLKGNIPVEANNQKRTIVVHWEWPFNENDETTTDSEDATLGQSGKSSLDCGFDIQIIGKQAQA